ncbi:MAG: hypothetical protein JXL84_21190 [Deltaproteobacteria bacterium]|nr:hypothetical protein [Deltaproteobacteria bacterium]
MDRPPEEVLKERAKRVEAAVHLEEPDKVPFVPFPHLFPARYSGMTLQEFMYDYDKAKAAAKKFMIDFEPDMGVNPIPLQVFGPVLEILDYRQVKWPGHGVSENTPFQYVEGEYLQVDEYQAFLSDPTDFMLRKYLPRICGALSPLRMLPDLSSQYYLRLARSVAIFGLPEVAGVLKTLLKAGEEAQRMLRKTVEFGQEMKDLGFPLMFGGAVFSPFDFWGNHFRGTRGVMLDLYRHPEKILRVVELILPKLVESTVAATKMTGSPYVFIPLHKGIDGFMSPKQFERFYWPGLRELMMGLIREELVPCPLWEGNCVSRLEVIGDVPKGKAIYWFEQTDLFRAKEVLGDTVCLRGNVPASLLVTGSPQQVEDYCKELIDRVGKNGGFIMDGAAGIPEEARPENVRVMERVTREYGTYH